MLTYIGRRLLQLPILLFGVTTLIFALLMILSPYERLSIYMNEEIPVREDTPRLLKYYHQDDPVYVQYVTWIQGLLHGNLGFSYVGKEPVADLLKRCIPLSLELAIWSVVPILVVGIRLGVLSAVHQDGPLDYIARIFSLVGWSTPNFVLGLLALMLFYARLDWFEPGRVSLWAERVIDGPGFVQYTRLVTFDAILNRRLDIFVDALRHLALPVITLSYSSLALLLRITRSSMLETMRQDYVVTARAKGLRERDVIYKHARRNALASVITVGGLVMIGFLGGVVTVETVFAIHGMGWFFAQAAVGLDVSTVVGFTLFYATVIVFGNLIVDILYAYLDPRVRYS